jgi:stress response protein YsnF
MEPDELDVISKYDDALIALISELHTLYMKRYIRKNDFRTDQEKHIVLRMTLEQYRKGNVKVTKKIIEKRLTEWGPVKVNKLVREKLYPKNLKDSKSHLST